MRVMAGSPHRLLGSWRPRVLLLSQSKGRSPPSVGKNPSCYLPPQPTCPPWSLLRAVGMIPGNPPMSLASPAPRKAPSPALPFGNVSPVTARGVIPHKAPPPLQGTPLAQPLTFLALSVACPIPAG